jgi:hypothetical protein
LREAHKYKMQRLCYIRWFIELALLFYDLTLSLPVTDKVRICSSPFASTHNYRSPNRNA